MSSLPQPVDTVGSEAWELPEWTAEEFVPRRSRYAVLIPVLNEGERIRAQLERMTKLPPAGDVVIVDGGSSDNSLDHEFLKANRVRSLLKTSVPGQLGDQLRAGLAYVLRQGYDGVVLIDGNNKDNPVAIPTFMNALNTGWDHIQGSRFMRGGREIRTPWIRKWAVRLIHAPLISMASHFPYTDTTNGFRAYSRRFLVDANVQPFRAVFRGYELHYYLAVRAGQLGFKIKEIPVERAYPEGGPVPSKISLFGGSFVLLRALISACLGLFDPKD